MSKLTRIEVWWICVERCTLEQIKELHEQDSLQNKYVEINTNRVWWICVE